MAAEDVLRTKKIGVLGAGNLGQSLLRAFADSQKIPLNNLFASSRNETRLQRFIEDVKITPIRTNEELVDKCDVVILGIKPQDLYAAIEPIAPSFHSGHVVLSLAAGIQLKELQGLLPNVEAIVRVMPNTAARLKKSAVAIAANKGSAAHLPWIELLLSNLGLVVRVDDGEAMEAMTVASSSGIGFVFELMIYWQEWLEERGFPSEKAREITAQVFLGAASLAQAAPNTSFEEQLRRITSAKGVTAAGLDSMRELEIERLLRISFEKAGLRDRELGQQWQVNAGKE